MGRALILTPRPLSTLDSLDILYHANTSTSQYPIHHFHSSLPKEATSEIGEEGGEGGVLTFCVPNS